MHHLAIAAKPVAKYAALKMGGAAVKRGIDEISKHISGEKNTDDGGVGKKTKNEQQPVTQYHEQEVQYTRSSTKESKKSKSKRKFTQKVKDVLYQQQSIQTVIRLHQGSFTSAAGATNGQFMLLYSLYGDPAGFDDLYQIQKIMQPVQLGISSTTVGVPNAAPLRKNNLFFTHATMELTLLNTSAVALAFLDIYEVEFRKDMAYASPYSSLELSSSASPGQTVWSNVAGETAASVTQVGMTPFQFPEFTSRCSIISKRKMQLAPLQTTLLTYSDVRHRKFDETLLEPPVQNAAAHYVGLGGWTRGYIVFTTGSLSGAGAYQGSTIAYSAMKRYSIRVISNNSATAGVI